MSSFLDITGRPVKSAQATAAPADPDALIRDGDLASFMADVIEASLQRPILVDFWADWCGPCKQLTPILERAVTGAAGKVRLVKIDVDRNPELAQQLRIQSMPTVYAFFQGQPVDAFQGLLPESQVKAFIDRVLKIAGTAGGANEGDDADAAIAQGAEALALGELDRAAALYHEALMLRQSDPVALIGLIRVQLAGGDLAGARLSLGTLPPEVARHKDYTALQAALDLAAKAEQAGPLGELERAVAADPAAPQARFDLAVAQYAAGQVAQAADNLLQLVVTAPTWNDGAAKAQLLTMFEALGAADPTVRAARRKLSGLLFS